jgi:hypothetical protein
MADETFEEWTTNLEERAALKRILGGTDGPSDEVSEKEIAGDQASEEEPTDEL